MRKEEEQNIVGIKKKDSTTKVYLNKGYEGYQDSISDGEDVFFDTGNQCFQVFSMF